MINLKYIFGAVIILMVFISCGGEKSGNGIIVKPETPKALQKELDDVSYSREGDLLNLLYQELVDKTPVLKKLEEDLAINHPKHFDLQGKFRLFDNKSLSYYGSANNAAAVIKDSLLRLKILTLITTHSNKYTTKSAEINSLMNQLSKKDIAIDDQHAVMKIVLTLPIIEKFQNENMPDKKEYKSLIKEQELLLLRTDSLIPNY